MLKTTRILTAEGKKRLLTKQYIPPKEFSFRFTGICIECKESFESKCSRSLYCSPKCKNKKDTRVRIKEMAKRSCKECGKEFEARFDTNTFTCSRKCGGLHSRRAK